MKLEPFNLETALAQPERVVNNMGEKVTQLTVFEVKNDNYPLHGVVKGNVNRWSVNGAYLYNPSTDISLALLPEIKRVWMNIYEESFEDRITTFYYKTKDIAIKNIDKSRTYIKTICITNQPDEDEQ